MQRVACCARGLFVSKRPVDVAADHPVLVGRMAQGWDRVSPWIRVALGAAAVLGGGRLVLGPPSAWFAGFAERRLVTGPGRGWSIHAPTGLPGPEPTV